MARWQRRGMSAIRYSLLQRYLKAVLISIVVMMFPMAFVRETVTFIDQLMDVTKDCKLFNNYLGTLNQSFWLKAKPQRSKADMYSYQPEDGLNRQYGLPPCTHRPQHAASMKAETETVPSWSLIESQNADVKKGGQWGPPDCVPRHRLAIIIPYRDREIHLRRLLYTLHPFLKRQNLDYRIFVVEQDHSSPFNRGAVKNIGALIAMQLRNFDCFYFHDVDLIPKRMDNIYFCGANPRHLSFTIKKTKSIDYAYSTHFGGVISLTKQHFINANGFSNVYFTWGSEDDDLSKRLRHLGYTIEQNDAEVGVYDMMTHVKDADVRKRYWQLLWGHCRYHYDGLTSLPFRLINIKNHKTHTLIRVAIDEKLTLSGIPDLPEPPEIGPYLKPLSRWDAIRRFLWK